MTPQVITDGDDVLRYVSRRHIQGPKINGAAFCRRPGETALSVNLLDAGGGLDKAQQVNRVREAIHLEVRPSALFAELNVGAVRRALRGRRPNLRFAHSPSPATPRFPWVDPTHCEIHGLPPADSPQSLIIGDMMVGLLSAVWPAARSTATL